MLPKEETLKRKICFVKKMVRDRILLFFFKFSTQKSIKESGN
jgi:hypothetical protein